MRYQVPQFIDVEDKIFGPLTFKQLVYVGGGIGAGVILFIFVKPAWLAFLIMSPVIALGAALAFLKVNNKPFIYFLQAFVTYGIGDRLYVWRKKQKKTVTPKQLPTPEPSQPKQIIPKISASTLTDLASKLDYTNIDEEEKS